MPVNVRDVKDDSTIRSYVQYYVSETEKRVRPVGCQLEAVVVMLIVDANTIPHSQNGVRPMQDFLPPYSKISDCHAVKLHVLVSSILTGYSADLFSVLISGFLTKTNGSVAIGAV